MDSQFIEKWLPAIMAMSFPLFVTFGLGIITYFLDITKLVSFHFMVRNITIEYSYTVDLILSYFATHGIMGNYSVEWDKFNEKLETKASVGKTYYQWKGHWIRISIFEIKYNEATEKYISMSTLSYSKSILMDFVTEICKEEMNKKAISYIYSSRNGKISYWEKSNLINKRTLSSVIMDEGIKNYLLSDMKKFLNDRARYESLGISWKRGYLISGPAGTGKSSLIAALANELKLKLCVIHCPRSTDDLYDLLMQAVPLRSVILLEDCDTWVNSLQSKQNNSTTKKDRDPTKDETSSELLNALDGVGCFTPGRIIFLTTNYKENIPERLIRPGRIDVNVHIGEMTIDQSKSLFKHFFTNASQDNINAFETKMSELMQSKKTITSAALSSYLLSKETADDAINNIHMMCNK